MAELKVTLDGDAIRDATTQAILGILPEETKAKILEQAVIALLTPSTDSWAKKKPRLDAFGRHDPFAGNSPTVQGHDRFRLVEFAARRLYPRL